MDFKAQQQQFMDYIKNPQNPIPEGIEPRRMTIYRELFFNNVDGFVSSAFPVLKSLYSQQAWGDLVQQFFEKHDCQTPIFVEIAQEFLSFLQNEYQLTDDDPVFMLELAHYEWLELVVAISKPNPAQQKLEPEQVSHEPLCFSSLARIAQYAFDVQHISLDYQPIEPPQQPQFFCVYLDDVQEVAFLQLNPLSAQVLAYIDAAQQPVSFSQITDWLMTAYPNMAQETISAGCLDMLKQMAEQGIVVTTKQSTE
ncbi:DUF2063 domain-containing protein [Shewanella sp. WXL01]|uniref:HvfC family RiPP maturation protein n=1 Tax=Shewanella sp. WXL01 TaxID=2709721 RepID=UPI0014385322|nr:putative DNA-binding domain-containing protein [Shewanella sp. WXL01]NKF52404.1 DUF2063 domain-containing protein [Shewanella sp. WXL01]